MLRTFVHYFKRRAIRVQKPVFPVVLFAAHVAAAAAAAAPAAAPAAATAAAAAAAASS